MKYGVLLQVWLVLCWSVAQPVSAEADIELETTTARVSEFNDERWFDGIVEAVNRSTVSAQTSGRIINLDFDVDDFVKAGEVIVRFSDVEHKARLAQSEADLQAAIATRKGAESEFKRIERLLKSGTVSKAHFDSSKAIFDATKAKELTAKAAIDQSREQLDYTIVRAPYSGLVVARHVQIGEIASAGQPLMTGFSLEKLRVSVAVPQQYAGVIRQAGSALVADDIGGFIQSVRLTVFPFADDKSNTVTVRAELPADTKSVFPGMMVKIGFTVGVSKALTIPATSLVRRGEVSGVYLLNDTGDIKLQQVRIGRSKDSGDIEVLSGLKAGDQIANDPNRAMQAAHSRQTGSQGDTRPAND